MTRASRGSQGLLAASGHYFRQEMGFQDSSGAARSFQSLRGSPGAARFILSKSSLPILHASQQPLPFENLEIPSVHDTPCGTPRKPQGMCQIEPGKAKIFPQLSSHDMRQSCPPGVASFATPNPHPKPQAMCQSGTSRLLTCLFHERLALL